MQFFIKDCPLSNSWRYIASVAMTFLWTAAALAYDPAAGDFTRRPGTDLRLLTYNVHNNFIYTTDDDGRYQRVIKAVNPDVIAFQEMDVSLTADQIAARLESYFPGTTWQVHLGKADGSAAGVSNRNVIASRYGLFRRETDTTPASDIRGVCMAMVDLPNAIYDTNIYIMNVHMKAGGTDDDILKRQEHCDAVINWMRDVRTPGGQIDGVAANTPMILVGDTNINTRGDRAPYHQTRTLFEGDIYFTGKYGASSPPDWDGTSNSEVAPYDYNTGLTWTHSSGDPAGRIDRFFYTDSVIHPVGGFVLNTRTMTDAARSAAGGLLVNDTSGASDHLPVVSDFVLGPDPNPPAQLVINEFCANDEGTDDRTFLEIKNIGGREANLDGPVDYVLKQSDPLPTAPPTIENEQYEHDLIGVVPAGGLFVIYSATNHSDGIASLIQSRLPALNRQDLQTFVLDNDNDSAIALVQKSMTRPNVSFETPIEAYGWATANPSLTRYFRLDSGNNRTITMGPAQWTDFLLNGAASDQTAARYLGNTTLNNYSGWFIPSPATPGLENPPMANIHEWMIY